MYDAIPVLGVEDFHEIGAHLLGAIWARVIDNDHLPIDTTVAIERSDEGKQQAGKEDALSNTNITKIRSEMGEGVRLVQMLIDEPEHVWQILALLVRGQDDAVLGLVARRLDLLLVRHCV